MPASASIRELRNGRKHDNAIENVMIERNYSKGIAFMIAPETNDSDGPKIGAKTQEEMDEQIRNFIASLMGQLDDLTWPFQRTTAATNFTFI